MLRQQFGELHTANQHQKRKRQATRTFIATGGILTGAEGQQLAHEAELQQKTVQETVSRKRAPPWCSNCDVIGHTRIKYPSK